MNKLAAKSVEIAFALFDKERHSPRCFVISFAWWKNRVLAIGINSEKTNPNNLRNPLVCRRTGAFIEKSGTCSEYNMFRKLKHTTNIDFNKITIFNVRITREGKIGMSRCCNSCESLIRYIQPKNVFYTLDSYRENPIFQRYEIL